MTRYLLKILNSKRLHLNYQLRFLFYKGNIKFVMQSTKSDSELFWNPLQVFDSTAKYNYALMILNRPILLGYDKVLPLWERASVKVLVDGGATRWINYLGDIANGFLTGRNNKYLPTLVTGDMDSILPEHLTRLKCTNTNVIYTPDQNKTDFTKSIIELGQYIKKNCLQLDAIHVIGDTSGRLDHLISSINTLHECDKYIPNVSVILISSNSLTWLLQAGNHRIHIPDALLKSHSWCSLVPFGSNKNHITTTGLKWNLNNSCLKFGGMLSTSNSYAGTSEVTVSSDVPIVWSMGIESITGMKEL